MDELIPAHTNNKASNGEMIDRLDNLFPSLTIRIPQSQKSNATITCKPQYKLISWQTYWSRNNCHNDVKVDADRTLKEEWWWGMNCLVELSPLIYLPKSCWFSNQIKELFYLSPSIVISPRSRQVILSRRELFSLSRVISLRVEPSLIFKTSSKEQIERGDLNER